MSPLSFLIITRAPKNSFHEVTKAKRVTVMTAGTMVGRKTLRRICKELAPSTSAASSNSRGTASKALRMM